MLRYFLISAKPLSANVQSIDQAINATCKDFLSCKINFTKSLEVFTFGKAISGLKKDDADVLLGKLAGQKGNVEKGAILGSLHKKQPVSEDEISTKVPVLPKKDFEFQIIDTKNTVVINPFLLLSKLEKISPVFPGKIFVVNKKGAEINLEERKSFASGIYSIYRENSVGRMPLKTSVFVNGEETSTISYDTLLYKNSRICVSGKDFFPIEKIYPNSKRQFLGDIEVSRGKNLITVVVTDSLGIERRISHTIEAW